MSKLTTLQSEVFDELIDCYLSHCRSCKWCLAESFCETYSMKTEDGFPSPKCAEKIKTFMNGETPEDKCPCENCTLTDWRKNACGGCALWYEWRKNHPGK